MLAEHHKKTNGRGEHVGSVSDAGRSFASTARKPEKAAPFHERVEVSGNIMILEHNSDGITVITSGGVFINPWTLKPFQLRSDAIKAVKWRGIAYKLSYKYCRSFNCFHLVVWFISSLVH